jgi:catechol 2,3-dioxygenase-like lactoylglutathione lyase family enzyme
MSDGTVFERIAPVVPVRDLDAALDRYRRLGFAVRPYRGGERYGFADRDGVSLHLVEWSEHDPGRTGAQVYIYVSDADAVHAKWMASGVEGRLGTPGDTAYGLREFSYVDADGTLHRVGSPIPLRAVRATL